MTNTPDGLWPRVSPLLAEGIQAKEKTPEEAKMILNEMIRGSYSE
jgi:hypothetical protein